MGKQQSKPAGDTTPRVKIILMGNSGVGKTSLAVYQERGVFHTEPNTYAECQLYQFSDTCEGVKVKGVIMDALTDTDLQAKIPCRLKCVKNADCAVVVFEYGRELGLEDVREKIGVLEKYEYQAGEVILVANKSDLDSRLISDDEIHSFLKSSHPYNLSFYRTSCKTGSNVSALFSHAIQIGFHGPRMRWDCRKSVVWLYDQQLHSESEVSAGSSAALVLGTGLCQAIPDWFTKKKRTLSFDIAKLPKEVVLLVLRSLL